MTRQINQAHADIAIEVLATVRREPDIAVVRQLRIAAAASELLQALHALVNSPNAKQNAMWDRARAAIAKAEGDS